METNKESASLALPHVSVDAAMSVQDKWSSVAGHVESVWSSSAIGRALMDKAMRQVNLEKMSAVIDGFVKKMSTGITSVTAALLEATREEFVQEMQRRCTDATKAFDQAKEIECIYRGVVIRVICTSPLDQYNLRVAAWVRGLAVDEQLLTPLWCESELIGGTAVKTGRAIEASVLVDCKCFRDSCHDLLSVVEATGPNIEDVIKRKGGFLQAMDRMCRLELAFWCSTFGDKARERVQTSIKACLPGVGRPMLLSDSLYALDKLGDTKLLVFAGAGMQSMFKTVQGFVGMLKLGGQASSREGWRQRLHAVREGVLGLALDLRARWSRVGCRFEGEREGRLRHACSEASLG